VQDAEAYQRPFDIAASVDAEERIRQGLVYSLNVCLDNSNRSMHTSLYVSS